MGLRMFRALFIALFLSLLPWARSKTYRFGYFFIRGTLSLDYEPTVQFINSYLQAQGSPDNFTTQFPIIPNGFDFFEYDFIFAFPSIKICMDVYRGPLLTYDSIVDKAGYEYQPIATMTVPYPTGFVNTTDVGVDTNCGLILVHVNSTIFTGADVAARADDLIIQFGHPLAESSGLLQLYQMLSVYDTDIFLNHKMLRFNDPDYQQIVFNLLANQTDVGFVGADLYYSMNLTADQRASLRVIDASVDPAYPYTCSTPKLSSYLLFANPTVPVDLRQRVVESLLNLPAGGVQAQAAEYYRWTPALSSSILMEAMERTRLFLRVPGLTTCPPPAGTVLYDFLQCPDGYYKLPEAANYDACVKQGTPCSTGNECYCSPCRKLPSERYLVRATLTGFSSAIYNETYVASLKNQSSLLTENLGNSKVCTKLKTCYSVTVGANVTLVLTDLLPKNLGLGLPAVNSVQISTSTVLNSAFVNMTQSDNSTWHYSFVASSVDVLVVQVRVNGEDIQDSPFLIPVLPVICKDGRAADANGLCSNGGVPAKTVLGLAIGLPVGLTLFFLLLILLFFVLVARWERNRYFIRPEDVNLESAEVKGLGLVGLMNGAVKVHLHPVVRPATHDKRRGRSNNFSIMSDVDEHRQGSVYAGSLNGDPIFSHSGIRINGAHGKEKEPHPPHHMTRATAAKQIQDIIKICKKGRHPALAYCYGYTYYTSPLNKDEQLLCLVEEYSEYGTLADLMDNKAISLETREIIGMARDVASALSYLHGLHKPMPHGNVRPSSILVNDKLSAKLAWRGSDAVEPVRGLGNPSGVLGSANAKPGFTSMSSGATMASAVATPTHNNNNKERISRDPLAVFEQSAAHRDTATMNSSTRANDGMVVDKSVAKDVEDFGSLLLQMFYPLSFETLMLARGVSAEKFEEKLRANTEVPLKVQSLITECLDPDANRRPACKDIYLSLERLVDATQSAGAAKRRVAETDLIDKLFPRSIATQLKEGKPVEPEFHEDVTVLFSDICEYTVLSSKLDARDVQATLDALYKQFDRICAENGVFRIEMVGDSFVCVGGLDIKCTDHTARVAKTAIEMIQVVSKFAFRDSRGGLADIPVNVRIGVHVGPVVGTVLGSDRPRFTVIGDVVNTTSRLESTSSRNRIHLSEEAAQALTRQDSSIATLLTPRGVVELKGKGPKKTYWLATSHEESPKGPMPTAPSPVDGETKKCW